MNCDNCGTEGAHEALGGWYLCIRCQHEFENEPEE